MFWFAYGLMNRSIERWFSSPVEEVQQDTALMATLLSRYASENAHAEAIAIAALPETQRAFQGHSFSGVVEAFRAREYWTIEVEFQTEAGDRFTAQHPLRGKQVG